MQVEKRFVDRVEQALAGDARVETLVALCLEVGKTVRPGLLAEIEARAPELLPVVVDRLQQLRDLGLEVDEIGEDEESFPDQLGDFKLLRRIGAGGMGVVFLAQQVSLGRQVVLKLVRPGQLYFAGTRDRFRREVEAVARLEHPGIVPIYGVGEEHGIPYYAMQHLVGASLASILLSVGGQSPARLSRASFENALVEAAEAAEALDRKVLRAALPGETWVHVCLRIVARVAEVLEYAHERDIVHRDVKPSNIFVTLEGRVLLLDFGLAASERAARITRSGAMIGTLPYMPPEQLASGRQAIDRRSDVYSLGVVLFELLTLHEPYLGPDHEYVRAQILRGAAPSPRLVNALVSRDVETVCLKAFERDRLRRYPTAGAFAADLDRACLNRPIAARPPSHVRRSTLWVRRNKERSVGLAALGLLIVLTGLFAAVQRRSRLEVERLSDTERHQTLLAGLEGLWPLEADNLPAADRWLDDARALIARKTYHERDLESLRRRALPYTEADRRVDQQATREHAQLVDRELAGIIAHLGRHYRLDCPALATAADRDGRLQDFQDVLSAGEPEACMRAIAELLNEMGSVRACLSTSLEQAEEANQILACEQMLRADLDSLRTRRTWRFESTVDAWRHESLAQLVASLGGLPRLVQDVESQCEKTGRIAERFAALGETWVRAIESIAELPAYAGLRLRPDTDLEPLGLDPDSGLWEFLVLGSGDPPAIGGARDPTPPDENAGIVLVLIPGGPTSIGRERGLYDRAEPPSTPPVELRLDPYWIAAFELTIGQAERLGWSGPPRVGEDKRQPFTGTWETLDALLARSRLALPTEAQWEHACRAGAAPWVPQDASLAFLEGQANLADRSFATWQAASGQETRWVVTFDDGYPWFAPVGSFRPNPFGLYDTLGNVSEWCREFAVVRAYRTILPRPRDGLFDTVHKASLAGHAHRGLSAVDNGTPGRDPVSARSFGAAESRHGARPARLAEIDS